MGDLLANARIAFTALGAVLAVAITFFLVVAAVALGIGVLWGAVFGGGSPADAGEQSPVFNVSGGDGSAAITYEAGEPLPAEEIFVLVDGDHRGAWAEFDHDGEEITRGDSIEVDDVQAGDEIRIQAVDEDGVTTLHRESV